MNTRQEIVDKFLEIYNRTQSKEVPFTHHMTKSDFEFITEVWPCVYFCKYVVVREKWWKRLFGVKTKEVTLNVSEQFLKSIKDEWISHRKFLHNGYTHFVFITD